MTTSAFDFHSAEVTARMMTEAMLHKALADILDTLDSADALDRLYGSNNGGRYRDQSSVYRRELARREKERAADEAAYQKKVRSVEIDTRPYERNHGAGPRGMGTWAFHPSCDAVSLFPDEIIWVNQMTFAQAKKVAREKAAAMGWTFVLVLS